MRLLQAAADTGIKTPTIFAASRKWSKPQKNRRHAHDGGVFRAGYRNFTHLSAAKPGPCTAKYNTGIN